MIQTFKLLKGLEKKTQTMYKSTGPVFLACFVVGVAFLLNVQAKELSSSDKEHLAFQHHLKLLIKEGKCSPKIRLYQILDHPDVLPGVIYSPPAAVLHVCDSTGGCCYQGALYRCQPAETEKVDIIFMAKHVDRRDTIFQTFTFDNHTRCECEEWSNDPR